MPPMIECERVSKAFMMRTNRQYLLKDRALAMVRPHLRESRKLFWALQDVSLAVEPGEAFGVIGPNGAGKTTLFRVIAAIFPPTNGTVHVHGRLAPLLALGVGFHPELTGRENIYLSSAMFGFTTREIRAAERASSPSPSSGASSTCQPRTTRRACRPASGSPSPFRCGPRSS